MRSLKSLRELTASLVRGFVLSKNPPRLVNSHIELHNLCKDFDSQDAKLKICIGITNHGFKKNKNLKPNEHQVQ